MDITSLLQSDTAKQIISSISDKTGISSDQASQVVQQGLPTLLGAIQSNASSPQGAGNLLGALAKHDGSILDNLSGFLNGSDFTDGSKIIGHVLGNEQTQVQNALSQKTGVNSGIISKILPMLAPIIMGYLGKKTQQSGVNNPSDLSGMLGGILSNLNGSGLTSMLDQNNDGKLDMSDAMAAVTKKGGLGGLFGSLFGGKK